MTDEKIKRAADLEAEADELEEVLEWCFDLEEQIDIGFRIADLREAAAKIREGLK